MKKAYLLFLLLMPFTSSFCQVNLQGTTYHLFTFSLGVDQPVENNQAFNSWTLSNYNRKLGNSIKGSIDLSFIGKSADAGAVANAGSFSDVVLLYWGPRLTPVTSPFSSFLNFQFGLYNGTPGITPVNYVPTTDQQGKHLHLYYEAAFFGLSSKNYFNKLHFKTGKGKKGISWNTGFHVDAGYEPWADDWKYGYYKGEGKYSTFVSNRINTIPNLNKVFFNAGIFAGIGS